MIPRFIAFEGGEGAGKSTQIQRLAQHLQAASPLITREPGGTPAGRELRRLLLTGADAQWTREAETLLMVADRAQHIAQVIRPALDAGQTVISDRFAYSTLAYQGAGRGIPRDFILSLHETACEDLWPDLVILLDLDPRIGLARSGKRLAAQHSAEARFEGLDLAFHDRVRQEFLDLAAAGPAARTVVIDAGQGIDAVQVAVRRAVDG